MNLPWIAEMTAVDFTPSGMVGSLNGLIVGSHWNARTGDLYYIAKSYDRAHAGRYRVYPRQLVKVYAPPPRADGRSL